MIEQKTKIAISIKKDPQYQDLSPNLSFLDYIIWDILENKTNAMSHSDIGLLTTAIEKEWNKMPEEFILKACILFPRHVDTIKKNGGYIEKIYSFVSIFIFCCLFFKIKINLVLY